MQKKMMKKSFKCSIVIMLFTVLMIGAKVLSINKKTFANELETIDIRILNTTDIHGQINSKDYLTGEDYGRGGLARTYNLVEQYRKELARENTFFFDIGDVLFDYTTEYIMGRDETAIQPVYKAMAMMDYDAITLGNHEFDYGYDYLLRQLDGSGLRDITVLSNVVESKTGKHPFNEYILFDRKMSTNKGNKVNVKVGVIGETIPNLTSKTHSYAGILRTEAMAENVKSKVDKLKDLGADVIVVIAHTGMGPETPDPLFKNVGYTLSKIDGVDVVLGGHEHKLFPTDNKDADYYNLPGVDKKTNLVNGKNLILATSRGSSIGKVDLTLEVAKKGLKIINRKTEVQFVTKENTTENKKIASMFGKWEKELIEYSQDIIGEIKDHTVINNYLGIINDNNSIQILNDSKREFALKFAHSNAGKKYKDYPVIAASNYHSYGESDYDNFVHISGDVSGAELGTIQAYNNYLQVYTINGKQLREWLEWSASAFEVTTGKTVWEDEVMNKLMSDSGLKSLVKEEWINNWSGFFVFDGINYEINPSVPARYDILGNKISSSKRIKSMKYNGVEIKDNTQLLLATNRITNPTQANKGVENQMVLRGFNRSQAVLRDYIKRESKIGKIQPYVDYNWNLNLGSNRESIVKISTNGEAIFNKEMPNAEKLATIEGFTYYKIKELRNTKDTMPPHILLSQAKTGATAARYSIGVSVTDSSEIDTVKYKKGDYDIDYSGWNSSLTINNNFTVSSNGIYTVYAKDIHGNESVNKIFIDNFRDDVLEAPTVISYTNRKKSIKGTSEPDATIYFDAYTGLYSTKVNSDGTYSYPLPLQPSGTEMLVYAVHEEKKIESETRTITVKRTGPNRPEVDPINNKSTNISGNMNDDDATIVAIIGNTAYVSNKNGKKTFKNAVDIYKKGYKILEVPLTINKSGKFSMEINTPLDNQKVSIYNIDHIFRNSSLNTLIVEEVAPNKPIAHDISNIEKSIAGYIPNYKGKICNITLTIGDNLYNVETNKRGEFNIEFEEQLYAGQILELYAEYQDLNEKSSILKVKVDDIEKYVVDSSELIIDDVDTSSDYIEGRFYDGVNLYLAIANGKGKNFTNTLEYFTVDEDDTFEVDIENVLEEGTKVYVMYRFSDGQILMANSTIVKNLSPDKPKLLNSITNSDKIVNVTAEADTTVELTIGNKKYTTNKYKYDEKIKKNIYSFKVSRTASKTNVKISSTNEYGRSDILKTKVVKTAPDSPEVNRINSKKKQITGSIELFDRGKGMTAKKANEVFKDAQPKVKKTQTRIFASINGKNYEGILDNKGNFKIAIPKQKQGTVISIWGQNKSGRGPLTKIKITK